VSEGRAARGLTSRELGDGDPLLDWWHPVGWAHEVGTEPYGTVLLGRGIVVWRDDEGVAHCFRDLCLHRGTALSLGAVEKGELVCPYHGWTYGSDGRCTKIPQLPAEQPIPAGAKAISFQCEERYGLIWVCLGTPRADIPEFPEWSDPAYRHVPCAPYTWKTGAARMVENFTDFGHLGYLHDGLLGVKEDLVVPPHRVDTTGHELRYALSMTVPNTNSEFAVTDVSGELGMQTNTYVLSLPYAIHLQCTYTDNDTHRTLFFVAQPRSDEECTGYCFQSRDFDLGGADAPYAEFQEVLAEQDRPVVESQKPEELPLDLADELHLRFDRVAVAYRKALAAHNIR
jgi:phenylpropionate dioxygenase-like ring-hydroxylating dioxygenase large terminal subunit